jgi:hypothetical protein
MRRRRHSQTNKASAQTAPQEGKYILPPEMEFAELRARWCAQRLAIETESRKPALACEKGGNDIYIYFIFYKVHRYVVIPAGTLANYSGVSKNMRLA